MAEYRRRVGENLARADMEKCIFTGGTNKYRDAWLDMGHDALLGLAGKIRARVDAVDPAVRVGVCAVMSTWDTDGVNAIELTKTLAGNTRPFLRTAPESVEGVRAAISGGKLELGYDTVLLGAGESAAAVLAPITSLSVFLRSWLDAPVTASCFEELDGVRAVRTTMSGEDGRTVYELWLDAATREPMAAELAQDGKTVLRARFSA